MRDSERAQSRQQEERDTSAPVNQTDPLHQVLGPVGNRETANLFAAGFLVDDDNAAPGPRQMRKTDFLRTVSEQVHSAADGAMSGTGQTSLNCPWIDHWLGYFSERDAAHLEKAVRRSAPGAATATSAEDYIPLVVAKVRSMVAEWSRTGDLPQEVAAESPDAASLAMKSEHNAPASPSNPLAVQRSLGPGQGLEGGLRSRMESALGAPLGGVRIHTDGHAAGMASSLGARAFTVGGHVAFGRGQYQPGTLAGDALLAHELAHVTQQGQGPVRSGESPALEEEADATALGALSRLWAGRSAAPPTRRNAGLRLQRCASARPRQRDELDNISLYNWDAVRLTEVLARSGDEAAIRTFLDAGYEIRRFDEAYMTIRVRDTGAVEERRMGGLRGSTTPPTSPEGKIIRLNNNLSLREAASTLFHETRHLLINDSQVEEEIQVRIATEEFRIRQGLPPVKPSYRNPDGTVNAEGIRRDVESNEVYTESDFEVVRIRYVGEEPVGGWVRPR